MKREIASLLLEFNPVDTEKEKPFYKKWDKKIKKIEQKMSKIGGCKTNNVLQNWRDNASITTSLYCYLRRNYPVPIPHFLFFSFENLAGHHGNVEKIRWAGDLADKWLKDIFSGEYFYKRNKEYFTKPEVKYFLSCDWQKSVGNCDDLIDCFFNTKIKVNNLNLSPYDLRLFRNCFAHQIVIEYIKFLCNNKSFIKNNDGIGMINMFLREAYISTGRNISFKNHTYHSLKRLGEEWYISNMIEKWSRLRSDNKDNKIVQDYILFVCKNVKKIMVKKDEIMYIINYFLKTEYIEKERDFDFGNMTWQELMRLNDEWHLQDRFTRNPSSRKYLTAKWGKSLIKDFSYEKDGETWTIKEITTGRLLYEEGNDMRHCVYSYVENCIHGYCNIFSVSCRNREGNDEEKIATLEISRDKRLAQARGKYNSRIDNETANIIKIWADENQINCDDYFNRHRFYGQVA